MSDEPSQTGGEFPNPSSRALKLWLGRAVQSQPDLAQSTDCCLRLTYVLVMGIDDDHRCQAKTQPAATYCLSASDSHFIGALRT